ncbi:MAG: universal stress protein [Chloroflexi bacterium]|nr:universal stress protein [Chloroflexota bacterium]
MATSKSRSPGPHRESSSFADRRWRERKRSACKYLRESALRYLPNATPSFHVEFSEEPAEAIVNIATDLGVDAIAMATHGRAGIRHALAGSVAEHVMRLSPVPVILVGPAALELRDTAGRAL